MTTNVESYFDTRRIRAKSQDYPVKLRVYNGQAQLYPTIYGITPSQIEAFGQKRVSDQLAELKKKLSGLVAGAQTAADALDPFDFAEFEQSFLVGHPEIDQTRLKVKLLLPADKEFRFDEYFEKFTILTEEHEEGTIGFVFKIVVEDKIRNGKIHTAVLYNSAYVSLVKFGGNRTFRKTTVQFLKDYTDWMKASGNSKTTIGMYLRNLRKVFNEAIDMRIIKKDKCYPFGKKKYRIPGTRNIKKTYEVDDMQKFYYYECEPSKPWLQRAKDFALFIYFGNGLNPYDICLLKRSNIVGDLIIFERAKTEDTAAEEAPQIAIHLNEDLRKIIERQCAKDDKGLPKTDPESYLFDIFQPEMSAMKKYRRRQLFVEFINKWTTYIFNELGINKTGGTYKLRHTFSSVQRALGASIDDIGEFLGHLDPRQSKRYVASLPVELKRKASARLDIIKEIPETKGKLDNREDMPATILENL